MNKFGNSPYSRGLLSVRHDGCGEDEEAGDDRFHAGILARNNVNPDQKTPVPLISWNFFIKVLRPCQTHGPHTLPHHKLPSPRNRMMGFPARKTIVIVSDRRARCLPGSTGRPRWV